MRLASKVPNRCAVAMAAVAFISVVAACGERPARPCSLHADCPASAVCVENVCARTRADDCRLVACSVDILEPAQLSYANGAAKLRVEAAGGQPDEVRLLSDGALLATLMPPYEYTWDTTPVSEGSHEITAEARQGPTVLSSAPRTIVVDRSRPTVAAVVAGTSGSLPQHTPAYVEFSEPVRLPVGGPRAALEVTGNDGASLDTELTLSEDGTRLAIRLLTAPAISSQISLALKSGITDLAGNALSAPAPAVWTVVACSSATGCTDCSQGACSVAIASPGGTEHVNGSVSLQLRFSGAAPEQVELLKNGAVLANVAPPYRYTWDTRSEPEGSYAIVARATQGATVYSSEPRTVVVDRTAPTITGQSPPPGDTNVAVRAPITLQFSEPVRIGAASTADVVSVTGPGGIALSVSGALSADGRTLTLNYVSPPQAPGDVALAVRSGITDLAGNALQVAAPWVWHMPTWQSLGQHVVVLQDTTSYDCQLDTRGNPTVAWVQPDGIYVSRWSGTGWEAIGAAIHGPATPSGPVLAVAPSGEPIVAWTEDMDPDPGRLDYRAFVQHKTASGWEYLGQNPVGAPMAVASSLAVDAAGAIWIGLAEGARTFYHAVVRRYDGSSYWVQHGGNLNRAERDAGGPILQLDSTGAPWAAWRESAGFGGVDNFLVYNVYVSKLLPGGWVSVGGALNNNANAPGYLVDFAPVPGGYPVLNWVERLGSSNFEAWYRTIYDSSFSTQSPAAAASFYSAPKMAAVGPDDLYAVSGAPPYAVYRKIPGSSSWVALAGEDWRVDRNSGIGALTVRANGSGEVVLFWYEKTAGSASLYAKRLNR